MFFNPSAVPMRGGDLVMFPPSAHQLPYGVHSKHWPRDPTYEDWEVKYAHAP